MTVSMKKALILISSLGVLSACSYSPSINRQLGYEVDEGGFGNVTDTNAKIMSGEISVAYQMNARFTAEVPATITFPFNSAQLTPEAVAVLNKQASWINQFPELRFSVFGHTDSVGSNSYNYALGKRRAEAVVNYFASRGISRSRLQALVSYGETQPAIPNSGPEQANRRTVTEVAGLSKGKSVLMDGRYSRILYREYIASGTRAHPANTDIRTQVDPGKE